MGKMLGVADSTAAIDGGTITGVTTLSTTAASTVGFYGATPVVQRATGTTHTTTNVVTSASYGTLQVAQMQEVMQTLIALGVWAA
jgi:hypothetical protein